MCAIRVQFCQLPALQMRSCEPTQHGRDRADYRSAIGNYNGCSACHLLLFPSPDLSNWGCRAGVTHRRGRVHPSRSRQTPISRWSGMTSRLHWAVYGIGSVLRRSGHCNRIAGRDNRTRSDRREVALLITVSVYADRRRQAPRRHRFQDDKGQHFFLEAFAA